MRRRIALLLVVALAVGLVAVAGELSGVTLPDKAVVGGKDLVLNGMGVRVKMFFDIYVAGLYLPAKESDPAKILAADEPRQIVMHFLYKEVERKKLVEAWNEGFEKNSPDKVKTHEKEIAQFNALWGSMKKGDRVTITYLPGTGLRVEGDTPSGPKQHWGETIEGREFSDMVFAIWLGPKPPTEDLKEGLLGK